MRATRNTKFQEVSYLLMKYFNIQQAKREEISGFIINPRRIKEHFSIFIFNSFHGSTAVGFSMTSRWKRTSYVCGK